MIWFEERENSLLRVSIISLILFGTDLYLGLLSLCSPVRKMTLLLLLITGEDIFLQRFNFQYVFFPFSDYAPCTVC